MKDREKACYSFAAACDAAIEMETHIYKDFLHAIRIVRDKAARTILKDVTEVRLGIKQKLELAAIDGGLAGHGLSTPVPLMNLEKTIRCCDLHRIGADADNRKALAYSIQKYKDALGFYRDMAERCSGAPMAQLFIQLGDLQTRDLQELEDTYEEHFLR